ncbi:MAG TPA: transcription factor FapR [Desulfobacteria bacterium]|nr:transcription factor FapR [Desulfobacteria bacterium]
MVKSSFPKPVRLRELGNYIKENPFITDEDLAKHFGVSVQTIRLDRLELGIPELRERMKQYAESSYSQVKSLSAPEIIGELLDLELEKAGLSLLEITPDMVFQKNTIARGHILFAQANSLAVALVDAEVALTGVAKVTFIRPVRLGERIVAKASVNGKTDNKYNVSVTSRSEQEVVFKGKFRIFAMDNREGSLVENRS